MREENPKWGGIERRSPPPSLLFTSSPFLKAIKAANMRLLFLVGALNRVIQKVGWFSPTGLLRTAELGAPCKKNGQSQVTQKEQQIAGHAKRTADRRSRKKNGQLQVTQKEQPIVGHARYSARSRQSNIDQQEVTSTKTSPVRGDCNGSWEIHLAKQFRSYTVWIIFTYFV